MSDSSIKKYVELIAIDDAFLKYKLKNYFKNDIVNLKEYPVKEIRDVFSKCTVNHLIDLSYLPEPLKIEIKEFIANDLRRLRPSLNTLVLNTIKPITIAIDYMQYLGKDSILDYTTEDIESYEPYLEKNFERFCATTNAGILNRIQIFTIQYKEKDIKDVFEKSIWKPDELQFSPDRLNLTSELSCFSFYKIKNDDNRALLKKYIKYLITATNNAFSSIHRTYVMLKQFCLFFEDVSFKKITRADALDYLSYLADQQILDETYRKYIQHIIRFFDYLCISELVEFCPFYSDDAKHVPYDYKETALDDYIIFQMFNHIGKLPDNLLCMYLINVCCGIRVSEICALKIGCLRKEKDYCMLRYYSIKMRKDCYILIPDSLYEKLKKWEKERLEADPKCIYMFPSIQNPKTIPYQQRQYRKEMQQYIDEWGICEQDGTLYHFRTHAYRHTLAKDLVDADVPIFIISQILAHSSMQMTLAYAEVREEHKQKKFEQYIKNIQGLSEVANEEVTAEWLRQNLNKQVLPNGYCTLPCKMVCPHHNQCLSCGSFVTTIDFYDVHTQQLESLKALLPEYEKKGMLSKVATTKKDIAKLEEKIEKIEETEDF